MYILLCTYVCLNRFTQNIILSTHFFIELFKLYNLFSFLFFSKHFFRILLTLYLCLLFVCTLICMVYNSMLGIYLVYKYQSRIIYLYRFLLHTQK